MKLKIKAILLAVVLAFCFVPFGCGANNDPLIQLTLWHYYKDAQKNAFEKFVKEFNETEGLKQNISVAAHSKGDLNALTEEVMKSANGLVGADKMPDMFTAYSDTAFAIDKLGKVAELDSYFTKAELDEYISSYIEEGRFGANKKLKIFPFAKSTEVIMLNKTHYDEFKAENPSVTDDKIATVEGLIDMAKIYYEWTDAMTPAVPNDGKAFFGRDSFDNYMVVGIRQLGKEIFTSENTAENFSKCKNEIKKLWDCYYVPYISGYFFNGNKFGTADIGFGDIIATQSSSSAATFFPVEMTLDSGEKKKIDVQVLPPAYFAGSEKVAVQQGAGMVVAKTDSAKESAAIKFLKWITEKERSIEFAAYASYMPVKKDAGKEDILKVFEKISPDKKEIIKETVLAAVDVTKNFTIYNNSVIENGNEARNVFKFESSILTKARADRLIVEEKLKNGQSLDAAVESVNTQENFEIWYENLIAKLLQTR